MGSVVFIVGLYQTFDFQPVPFYRKFDRRHKKKFKH